MKKCIIASDSFKGSLSSMQISYICEQEIPQYFSGCEVVPIPVADGGEGTVDCVFAALGAEPVTIEVCGPFMERTTATYAVHGKDAVVELASAAGLTLAGSRREPSNTSTYGVGELMRDAIERGCTHIYLGLGGSATNDGGCGIAAALGVKFYNYNGVSYVPTGGTLKNLAIIDNSAALELLEGIEITIMCDVTNPLFGKNGAAYVYGPQKGADEYEVQLLDQGLEQLNSVFISSLGKDLTYIKGGGAAGGAAAGVMAMLGGSIKSGIDSLLDLTGFDEELEDCDLVITGEGRLDDQSFQGKVIDGICRRTLPKEIPVFAIVGSIGKLTVDTTLHGISAVFETNRMHLPFEEIKGNAWEDYEQALGDAMRYLKMKERRLHL